MRRAPCRLRAACGLLTVCVSVSGCGYSLAGRGSFLPAHIKRVGVPTFGNNTGRFELEQLVTAKVIAELVGRGKYDVVQQAEGVDAVLLGEITSLNATPAAFTGETRASRYTITVTAKIQFIDKADNKVIWSNDALSFRDEYDVTGEVTDPTTFFDQQTNALDRISTNFARSLISSILEAF